MAEEEDFESNSIEEEKVEDEPENVEPTNEEEESAPLEYTKKLGVEEEEEKEENPFTTFIKNCIDYLEG